jgi:hypothetical protein
MVSSVVNLKFARWLGHEEVENFKFVNHTRIVAFLVSLSSQKFDGR